MLEQEPFFLEKVLTQFIQAELQKYGFEKAVIALSGGLDSTVVTYLVSKILPSSQIVLLYMPYGEGLSNNDHVELVAKDLGLELKTWNMKEIADLFFLERSVTEPLRKGNILARLRMINAFDWSAKEKALVVGTSNKTELLIGYSTWYGDSAAGIMPIGDLFKTQVFSLAKHLHVPSPIIEKSPSAELWEGQTDEKEIGISYDLLDTILYYHVDLRYTQQELLELGYSEAIVQRVIKMCNKALYKQRLPIIPKVSKRTIGLDYLLMKETILSGM